MNRFLTGLVLIVLAAGVYFTFTSPRYNKVKAIQAQNQAFERAVEESNQLLREREAINAAYNQIDATDRERLNKLLPDHIDNIRLIIDINSIVAQRGVLAKGIRISSNSLTSSGGAGKTTPGGAPSTPPVGMPDQPAAAAATANTKYDSLTLSFGVSTSYANFMEIIRDLERSLRIIDVTSISFSPTDTGNYDFSIELKTYWLRQK